MSLTWSSICMNRRETPRGKWKPGKTSEGTKIFWTPKLIYWSLRRVNSHSSSSSSSMKKSPLRMSRILSTKIMSSWEMLRRMVRLPRRIGLQVKSSYTRRSKKCSKKFSGLRRRRMVSKTPQQTPKPCILPFPLISGSLCYLDSCSQPIWVTTQSSLAMTLT